MRSIDRAVHFLFAVEVFSLCSRNEENSRCSEGSSAKTTSTIELGFSHDVRGVFGLLHAEFGAAVSSGSASAPSMARNRKRASTARSRRNRELCFCVAMLHAVPRLLLEARVDCSNGLEVIRSRSCCLVGSLLASCLATLATSNGMFLRGKG